MAVALKRQSLFAKSDALVTQPQAQFVERDHCVNCNSIPLEPGDRVAVKEIFFDETRNGQSKKKRVVSSKSALPAEHFKALEQNLEAETSDLAKFQAARFEDEEFGSYESVPFEGENDLERMSTIPFERETDLDRTRFNLALLSASTVEGLEQLRSELQELQKLLKSEAERVQGQIDSALDIFNILAKAMSSWQSTVRKLLSEEEAKKPLSSLATRPADQPGVTIEPQREQQKVFPRTCSTGGGGASN
jgi:hypothetical protein